MKIVKIRTSSLGRESGIVVGEWQSKILYAMLPSCRNDMTYSSAGQKGSVWETSIARPNRAGIHTYFCLNWCNAPKSWSCARSKKDNIFTCITSILFSPGEPCAEPSLLLNKCIWPQLAICKDTDDNKHGVVSCWMDLVANCAMAFCSTKQNNFQYIVRLYWM